MISNKKFNLFFGERYNAVMPKRSDLFSSEAVCSKSNIISTAIFIAKRVIKINAPYLVSFCFALFTSINNIISIAEGVFDFIF